MSDGGALPQQSELVRLLVDHIPAIAAYWDADLRCRFANRAHEAWFGVSPQKLLGTHIRDLLGPLFELDRPYIEGALRGEAQAFERTIPDPAGGPPRQSLANYIPDVVDGVVRGFFVLVTDVTAVKSVEIALRESEERFRLTFEEAPVGIALVAPDGRFVRVNRALCDIVGYTLEELSGLTAQAITHPADLDAGLALAAKLARGEIPRYRLGKRYIRKDGAVVDVMLSGSAVRSPDGTPLYFIAQVEDVSEQKRREKQRRFLAEAGPVLAASLDYEVTLKKLAELAVDEFADLCIIDVVEGDVADAPEVLRLHVASRDPAKAWVCERLSKVSVDRRKPQLLRSVIETRKPLLLHHPSEAMLAAFSQSEDHLEALRGAEIASLVAVPLVASGRLLGAIAFVSSTGARVYGTADMHLAEAIAAHAALAIENARLYREARHAAKVRDEVLGIVAHDLRNPLNAVLLQANLLRRRHGPERRSQKPIEAIERATRRMDRLIQDLLDVTRLEAGKLVVNRVRLAPRELVFEVVSVQKVLAASHGIELDLELPGELPEVCGDRDRLFQVFENLIGNALKFTRRGGRIVVGARKHEGDVLFWVRDTGSGIPAENVPHLFDRFWQAKTGLRHGAGLGLPIVKGVIEGHLGQIWVESQLGEGSTFFFSIAACRDDESPPAFSRSTPPPP